MRAQRSVILTLALDVLVDAIELRTAGNLRLKSGSHIIARILFPMQHRYIALVNLAKSHDQLHTVPHCFPNLESCISLD
jgi:hypothetical protein